MPVDVILSAATCFTIAFGACLAASSLVKRTGIVDAPDGVRKQQAVAVPRLGGVAIAAGTFVGGLLGFIALYVLRDGALAANLAEISAAAMTLVSANTPLLILVAGAFVLGLWDDIWTANTKLKLLILGGISLGAATFGLIPNALTSPWGEVSMPLILIIGSAAWLLVFANAVNFVDGSNGLAVGSLAIMMAGLAVTGTVSGTWEFSILWFALFGSIAGFLIQNLRGKLYAGDAGALGLGALFGGLGLISGLDVWTIATLALPFLVDVLMTLIWRAKRGRNWLEPHTDHAYQRLIASGWRHLDVAILYWGLSATAAAMAYIAARGGGAAPFVVFCGLWIAGMVLWVRHLRSTE